ncbi:50S ribosomal protein L10 [Candidatus Woesearchaeota archaeon]|nr:50S ribosomal protein L10 [Candidatus Woesearchaeota archaeon]
MNKPKAHVAESKKRQLEEIKKLCSQYPVIALIDMENMPSPQLQKLRNTLRNSIIIRMYKGRVLKIALEQLKGKLNGAEELQEKVCGMPALMFTQENPFKLYKLLMKNKSSAAAKPGQKAPKAITLSPGPTPFAPGPKIGELGQLGIKTEIKEGKVCIKEEKLLIKEGEAFNAKIAGLLQSLGIEPMEIGLNLTFALENGIIFGKNVLTVDEQQYLNNVRLIASETMNLAIYIGYATKETAPLLVKKAARDSLALADSLNIITDETASKLLKKAEIQALHLKSKLNIPEEKEESEGTVGGLN